MVYKVGILKTGLKGPGSFVKNIKLGQFEVLSRTERFRYDKSDEEFEGENMSIERDKSMMRKLFVISIVVQLICTMFFSFMIRTDNKGEPVGGEFQVNTFSSDYLTRPRAAMDSSGNFVITWNSRGKDGWGWGVAARRFDSTGNPFGDEFLVNTRVDGDQVGPDVDMDPNGNFVIAWSGAGVGDDSGIHAQRFDNNGNRLGSEFTVNNNTAGGQQLPTVAMDANGNFVVAWSVGDIYARLFDNNGNPKGDDFRVNNYTADTQDYPSTGMDANGNFVITWHSLNQDGDSWGIYARRFFSNGTPNGEEFRVNGYWWSYQRYPMMDMNSTGAFVISWSGAGVGANGVNIYGRRYGVSGNPLGGDFLVNTYVSSSQHFPSVAMDSYGNFVIAWESENQDGYGDGIFAQKFDSSGQSIGLEFQVNTFTTFDQESPTAAMDPNGNFVIAWHSIINGIGTMRIYGQLYDNTTLLTIYDIKVQDITDTTATITWKTNSPANSTIDYGFAPLYTLTNQNDTRVYTHSMDLTGLEAGRLYHFKLTSYYDPTTYDISEDYTFTTKFPIYLIPGWNMISVPLNQTDTNLMNVLENISGDYDAVQWYDITDPVDPWKHHHTKKPSSLNDLTDVDKHMGLWIHITNPLGTTLYINGTAPEIRYVNQITLNNGWNLVGYPSLLERPPDSAGLPAEVDMVMWYNASLGLWESWDPGSYSPDNLNLLRPGQGLWIHYTRVTDVWALEYVI